MAITIDESKTVLDKKSVAKVVCIAMGALFLIIATVGFVEPVFLGTHLSMSNNIIHFFSGIFSIWMGMLKNPKPAIRFAIGFGAFYGFLGLMGFITGRESISLMHHFREDQFLLILIPGNVEFGTADHILHFIISGVYLTSVYLSQPSVTHTKTHSRFQH